jgi:hypothetical protein
VLLGGSASTGGDRTAKGFRAAEVDGHVCGYSERFVGRHFRTLVPGQRAAQVCWLYRRAVDMLHFLELSEAAGTIKPANAALLVAALFELVEDLCPGISPDGTGFDL